MTQPQARSTGISADSAELIREPTPCVKCRYDLRGLFVGNSCPECGTTIVRKRKIVHDKMGDAPAAYLNTLSSALLVFGLCGLLIPFGLISSAFGSEYGRFIALGALIVMPAAGMVVLRKRARPHLQGHPEGEKREWIELRRAIAIGYILQTLLVVTIIVGLVFGFVIPTWLLTMWVFVIGAGICASAWHISLLADWARDTSRAMQLRACSLGFGLYLILGLLSYIASVPLGGLFGLTPTTAGVPVLLSVLSFMFAFIGIGSLMLIFGFTMLFSGTVRWAVVNARTERERDQRMAERAKQRAKQMSSALDSVGTGDAPLFPLPDSSPSAGEDLLIPDGPDDFAAPKPPPSFAPDEDDDSKYNPYGLEE
ncbi:MAG: hypothetical protein ACNA8P_02350 [Phycisphaerales bacterium]